MNNELLIEKLSNNQLFKGRIIDSTLEIILLAYRLSSVNSDETPNKVIERFISGISSLSFDTKYDKNDIVLLKYCLSVFIDEMLMKNETYFELLADSTITFKFFSDSIGGDKFYSIVNQWLADPKKNKDYLEFILCCLLLGYRGKYANEEQCEQSISELINDITNKISLTYDNNKTIFDKSSLNNYKETFLQKLKRKNIITITSLIFGFIVIVCIFFTFYFSLEKYNHKIEDELNRTINEFMKNNLN